jgi:hypothetical protein
VLTVQTVRRETLVLRALRENRALQVSLVPKVIRVLTLVLST